MNEIIHGLSLRDDKIVVSVTSSGCTEASSFRLDAVSGITGYMLTVVRTVQDDCKAMPEIIEVELTIPAEIKGEQFSVQNRFASGPNI
jgi:hypothetical protein